jgi:protein-arginine kinase activator protein McsA
MKTCTKCNHNKTLDDFHNSSSTKDGKSYVCKLCASERSKLWTKANFIRRKNNLLKYLYNVDIQQYNDLLKQQNYSCAICKRNESEFKNKLAVDHCHTTLKIRGLLCDNCNKAIGYLKDDVSVLKVAISYLNKTNPTDSTITHEENQDQD